MLTVHIKDKKTVQYIWDIIINMYLNVMNSDQINHTQFKYTLCNSYDLLKNKRPHKELGYLENINCIVLALINILNNMYNLNFKNGFRQFELMENDIDYAVKILLNDIDVDKSYDVLNSKLIKENLQYYQNFNSDIDVLNSYFNPNILIFEKQIGDYLNKNWYINNSMKLKPNILEKIISSVNFITEYKIPKIIKINRINYFCSMKSNLQNHL
jgi:hypothetical protein